jgi:hypothetical protein
MMMIKRTETDIQREICLYLKCKGYFFWREGNQRRVTKSGVHCKAKFEVNGKPDIFVIDGAITWGIEVKTPKGKVSESQKEFRKQWEIEPVRIYRVVRSVEDVMDIGL